MIDIEELKPLIVERLKPLNPEKIILFGSFAYGEPHEDSDIDLFLIKKDDSDIEVDALMNLRGLIKKYNIGFDILSNKKEFLYGSSDYFYQVDILQKGKVIYSE